MHFPKRLLFPLLAIYLLLLGGISKTLFWPSPSAQALRIDHIALTEGNSRALVSGEGFDESTRAFIAIDVGNQRLLRNTLPTYGRGGELLRDGRFAYLANHQRGLVVLDLIDPLHPRIVGSISLPGVARTLAVAAHIAYVGCGDHGLFLVDIEDPTAPRLLAALPELTAIQGMTVLGDQLYAAIFKRGVDPALATVDISQPGDPRLLGRLPLPGQPMKVLAVGRFLCVAAGHAGLHVLTLDGSGIPQLSSVLSLPGSSHGMAATGSKVYVGSATGRLFVIDLAKAEPEVIGTHLLPGSINHLLAEEERLYAIGAEGGGQILDLSQPEYPRLIGYFDGPQTPVGMAAAGKTVYLVGRNTGVHVLDLDRPAMLQSVSQLSFGESVQTIALQQGLAFVTTAEGNLHVIDRSDPQSPQRIAFLPLFGHCRALALADGYAFAHIPKLGLQVIDIRDPRQPRLVATHPHSTITNLGTLALDGDLALLAGDDDMLFFLDISTPELPRISSALPVPDRIINIVVGDQFICATTANGELLLIDLATQRLRGRLALQVQQLSDLALVDRTAVVVSKKDGLLTIDITDLDTPRLLAVLPLAVASDRIIIQGDSAYVTERSGGIQLVDLADPKQPRPGAILKHAPRLNTLAVEDEYLYLAAREAGLLTLPLPQEIEISISTAQNLSFDLPAVAVGGHYTLRIDNGQQTVVLPGALQLTASPQAGI
jgi:hypothetical protein